MSAELAPARIIRTAPVPGYEEFYRVSEEGDVFRLARTFVDKRCGSRTHAPRLLRPVVVAGYKYVMLTDGKATHKRLAVLERGAAEAQSAHSRRLKEVTVIEREERYCEVLAL